MGEYSKFISPKRRNQLTPKSIVDEKGQCVFGTFDKEFEDLDLVRAKRPTRLPNFLNKSKLSLWEATEIHFDDCLILTALCDMDLFGIHLTLFFDKRTRKVHSFTTNIPSKKTFIAPNLLNGNKTEATHKEGSVEFINNFGEGKCSIKVSHKNKNGDTIQYEVELDRVSKPCIVSIPFGKNRPLYSQKDLFKAKGKVVFNGEEFLSDENSTAVIDDHRGYYPRRMHYDWLTTMGRNLNGEQKYFAFNLTRNQSINQEDYNENLIWKEGETSLLPPVTFEKNISTIKFKDQAIWKIKDEHDMVNIEFKLEDIYRHELHALVVDIGYFVVFGTIYGYVRDEEGNKISVDGFTAMGEDKTMLF
jgi:hypothetical protein